MNCSDLAPLEWAHVEALLDTRLDSPKVLSGGYSHLTVLCHTPTQPVVLRLNEANETSPTVESAVLKKVSSFVPVPTVIGVWEGTKVPKIRAGMALEYVEGQLLSHVLDSLRRTGDQDSARRIGIAVGEAVAAVGHVTFDHPGFFADDALAVTPLVEQWSQMLPQFVAEHEELVVAQGRLSKTDYQLWQKYCTAHTKPLELIDQHAFLVHSDCNPKNIVVNHKKNGTWEVAALLDWEFAHSGTPWSDVANMLRWGATYPGGFVCGFLEGFVKTTPCDLPIAEGLAAGHAFDLFARTQLLSRPSGHPVADQIAALVHSDLNQWRDQQGLKL